MKNDLELLKRINDGGDIYVSDVYSECNVSCPECYKNGNCELQNKSKNSLKVVNK